MTCVGRAWRPVLRTASTIVLNGGAVAVDSQRREPLELVRTPTGQSRSDGSSATTGQNLLEVAARSCLAVWSAYSSPPALATSRTGGSRRRHGAVVPAGLRKWSSNWVRHTRSDAILYISSNTVAAPLRLVSDGPGDPSYGQHRLLS